MTIYTIIALGIGIPSALLLLLAVVNYRRATKSERGQNRKIRNEMRAYDARIRKLGRARKRTNAYGLAVK